MDQVEFDDDLFQGAPHTEPVAVKGGTIKTDTGFFKWLLVAILIVVIMWIMHSIYKQVRIAGEDKNQRLTRVHFNNIRGEDYDEEAKQVIEYGEAIQNPRAIDHYRVGAVYLLNAQNPQAAHRHFTEALNQIIEGQVDVREAPFILNRIEDFHDRFVDIVDVDDLPIQRALMVYFNNQQNQLNDVVLHKPIVEVNNDDPEFKQKTLLSRQDWQSDSQNVHDSAIYAELKEQVLKVMVDNKKIKDIQLHGYDEAVNWLRVRYKNDTDKLNDVNKAIMVINNNYHLDSMRNMYEKDILTAVWQRTFDPDNKDKAQQIREAMGDAVLDCVERGHVVCMSGRTSKVWQALARLDKDEEVGILKTKQALRNEIYQKAAKVVDDFVGENGSASQALKESYNKSENTEQVKELIECMKTKIDNLYLEYKLYLPDQQLLAILEECKAVV